MSLENSDLIIEREFEGKRVGFRLSKAPSCGNRDQLELTGIVYESFPRQFEVRCGCGCGYVGIACMVDEEERIMKQPS